ncbi:uncharacterized [Tachysurus ichikawai]
MPPGPYDGRSRHACQPPYCHACWHRALELTILQSCVTSVCLAASGKHMACRSFLPHFNRSSMEQGRKTNQPS